MDRERVDNWIANGTATTEPVTSSTPEIPAEQPTPTPEVPAAEAPATPEAPAAEVPAVEAAVPVEEFFEAQYNGQPYKIPKGVTIPLKRGAETEFVSIEEAQKRGMLEKDYRQKTAELSEQRRQYELEQKVERARLEAQQNWLKEQQELYQKGLMSPEDQLRYENFSEMYRADPWFKKVVDDAVEGRMFQAERAVYRQEELTQALIEETRAVEQRIHEIGAQYTGVDPAFVIDRLSDGLQTGRLSLSEQTIHQLYQQEAAHRTQVLSPIQSELEALKAELAALKGAGAATAHNKSTQAAIQRTLNPVGAPAGGAPGVASPAAPQAKPNLTVGRISDRAQEWARKG